MVGMRNTTMQAIKAKYITLEPLLDERARRLWAAVEARSLGRGGIIRVAEATGLARATIRAGLKELDLPALRRSEGHSPGGSVLPGVDASR